MEVDPNDEAGVPTSRLRVSNGHLGEMGAESWASCVPLAHMEAWHPKLLGFLLLFYVLGHVFGLGCSFGHARFGPCIWVFIWANDLLYMDLMILGLYFIFLFFIGLGSGRAKWVCYNIYSKC